MQEDLEQRTVSVSIQAAKLSGRVLRAAIAAVLQKMEQERTMPKVGRNSMKRLTYKDPGANTIEVSGRIRSFERYARKHQVRYHIEKELGTDPPKWTVYFKANQADALTAAFKEYICQAGRGGASGSRSRRFPKAVRTVRRLCPCVSEYVAGGGNGLADRFMRCSHYAAGSLS